ncbi:LANO_0H07734g1_1 [Lachancea nothofagi CBS 11611]|uniref:LANO_0H07734g1_1 n=1 Tax=Lachancea nothofagi CBS 11611 TaxID=1266666 RepID=A0A1G4KLN4_9SACH|nr:LANO_0H07734g1_1 [Lachancea nothofagi CBS 11611]
MSLLSIELQQPLWNNLSQACFGNTEELEEHSPGVLAYNSLFDGSDDCETPEFYTDKSNKDPVLLESSAREEQLLRKFDSSMTGSLDSHSWSIDDILAECTPEKSSLWTGAISGENNYQRELSGSSLTTSYNQNRFQSDSDVVIDQRFEVGLNGDLDTEENTLEADSISDRTNDDNYKATFSANKPLIKVNTKDMKNHTLPSPSRLFVEPVKHEFAGKVSKPSTKKNRGKRSSKFNFNAKKASLQKLITELQSKCDQARHGENGFLIRRSVAKELDIEHQCSPTILNFGGTLFSHVMRYLEEQALHFQPAGQFRTIWNYHRKQQGSRIVLSLTPYNGETDCDGTNYQFSVVSRLLPHDCFGNPQSVSKKKTNKVQDELEREKRASRGNMFHWRHFLTSFEYFKLVSFMLGTNYDFGLNDNQIGETRGSDGKVISPEKRHDMRTRSHAKIYFEGKAVKSAHELVSNETAGRRKSFIVGTFGQIMGYTHMKPFGSDSSLSVMEFRYLEEALSKEINFHVSHSI